MKRLRTLIVDDEPLAIERLETLSADHPAIEVVGRANDGVEALRIAQQLTPDLIFLDIGMPKMDGINAARALGLMHKKPAIILITAYDNFAVEAFDLDVVDYVLKPVSSERLGRAIARAAMAHGVQEVVVDLLDAGVLLLGVLDADAVVVQLAQIRRNAAGDGLQPVAAGAVLVVGRAADAQGLGARRAFFVRVAGQPLRAQLGQGAGVHRLRRDVAMGEHGGGGAQGRNDGDGGACGRVQGGHFVFHGVSC